MEYVNPTTISFVAAGAGAGAYYVYANVIEPQNQAQRVLQAEQAQKELLLNLEEEEASRRGTNKQVKKKPIIVVRPKKVENDNSDVKPEDLNEKISTSNPFDLLEAQHAAANVTSKAKKGASKKKVEVTVTTAAAAPADESKTEKAVKFDPTPVVTELPKVVSKKERKAAASKKEVTPVTSPTAIVQLTVAATAAAASKKADQWSEAGSPREPEHLHTPEPFKPVRGHRNTFAAPAPAASTGPEAFQPVKSSKALQAARKQQQQKLTVAEKKPVEEPSKPISVVSSPVVSSPVVSAVSEEERLLAVQELKALQALVQARDLALAAAESRAERSLRKIQELQKQIESEAILVKSAQKKENRAQNLSEKVESLHYTNSLLVRQLSVEKENLKTAQLQAIKKEAELAATAAAAAAAAAAAEKVTKKSPDAEWEAKLEALEQERLQRAAQVEHLQELNRELQQHRTQSESEISQLSRSLVDADQRADSALRERNEVHHQLSMTVSDREARIASLEADIGALEGELEDSKVQVEQYAEVSHSRHEILEGEKHSLLEEIDMLRSQLAKEESKVLERDGEVKKLQQDLEVVRGQVRSLEANHASTLSAKHEEYQHILSTKESTLAVHITKFTAAQAEVETVRLQLKEARESHQGELERLGQELEKSNTQIATLTESQQAWTTKMTELTERSNESSVTASEQSAALNKRIHELEKDMASKESSHRIVLTQKDALVTELAQKKVAFEELETAKQDAEAELKALIEASDLKKSEIEQEYEALSLQVIEQEAELKGLRQQQQQQSEGEKGEGKKDQADEVVKEGTVEMKNKSSEQQHELFNVQVDSLAVATY
ncbi:hypothetical protein BGX24_008085 [Mortierella sp. AD032]|nr:hypothetical protein BGX24_008085 [Mortierella sp. AD032]